MVSSIATSWGIHAQGIVGYPNVKSFSFIHSYNVLIALVQLFFLLALPPLVTGIAPLNPYLIESAWSIAQHDNYAQASTLSEGPLIPGEVDHLFSREIAGALTVLYSADNKVVWGSSLSSVFKVDRSGKELRLIAAIKKDVRHTKTDTFRGIYSVLTKEGKFYISSSNVISIYEDLIPGDPFSGIRHVGNYDFGPLAHEKERVLALSFTYDGMIVFCTNQGGVGVLSTNEPPDLHGLEYATSNVGRSPRVSVTNSMSVDEFGGIYVVTSKYMHRLWWDAQNLKLHSLAPPHIEGFAMDSNSDSKPEDTVAEEPDDNVPVENEDGNLVGLGVFRERVSASRLGQAAVNGVRNGSVVEVLIRSRSSDPRPRAFSMGVGSFGQACDNVMERKCIIWSTPYPIDENPIEGRPTKEGSGTTPSLLKDEKTGRLYVVIADGQRRQEVLVLDSFTGEIVSSAPVQFYDDPNRESYTEQSILVSGNRLLLAQNALTPPGRRINEFLEAIDAERIVSGMDAPEFVQDNVYLLPVFLGDSPRGFQQFEFDTTGETPLLRVTWTRSDVGCPNSIPTMSETTGVMYCVGRTKSAISEVLNQGMSAGWSIEAFNWMNGETIFSAPVGSTLLFNSLYAATQIGPDREIIYGSVGGLVRIKSGEKMPEESALGGLLTGLNSMISSGVQQGNLLLAAAADQAVGALRLASSMDAVAERMRERDANQMS